MRELTTDHRAMTAPEPAAAPPRARRLRLGGALLAAVAALLALHIFLAYPSHRALAEGAEDGSGTVAVVPAAASVNEGELVTVSVWLTDAVDTYGLDVRLSFDPQVVSATALVPRWDLFDEENHIIVKDEWDNDAGTIWYAISNQNPAEPFTGTGEICALVFQGIEVGTSPLTITYAKGSTRDGEPITPTRQGGTIDVGRIEATLTPDYALQNTPYAIQTYTLQLANQGTSADTFHLTHSATDTSELSGDGLQYNWGVLSSTHTLDVPPGVTATLRITVQVPTFETTWVTHTLYLTATSATYPDQQLMSTLQTHTGGEWDPDEQHWVRCRFDYYGVGAVYFGAAQLVYDLIGTTDARYRNFHEIAVFFGDAQLVYERIGQSCAP